MNGYRDDHERYHKHGPSTDDERRAMTCPACGHPATAHNPRGRCDICADAAQVGTYAPCAIPDTTPDDLPPGADIDDDPDEMAAELAELTAAAYRAVEDRAQLARFGARDILAYYAHLHRVGWRTPNRIDIPLDLDILPESRDRDAWHARQYRAAVAERDAVRQADDRLGTPLRWTPIGMAGMDALR